MSRVISETLRLTCPVAVLSGPNIAAEIVAGNYAEAIIACSESSIAEEWSEILYVPNLFVPSISDDVAGVESGGALKNIVAVACGIVDGLRLGDNTKAVVMARGLEDIIAIGAHYGARRETFYGLSGLWDLITTCYSEHSRNRLVGHLVAQGKALDVALHELAAEKRGEPEGPETVRVIHALNGSLVLPALSAVYNVLYGNADPYV